MHIHSVCCVCVYRWFFRRFLSMALFYFQLLISWNICLSLRWVISRLSFCLSVCLFAIYLSSLSVFQNMYKYVCLNIYMFNVCSLTVCLCWNIARLRHWHARAQAPSTKCVSSLHPPNPSLPSPSAPHIPLHSPKNLTPFDPSKNPVFFFCTKKKEEK